MAVHVVYDATIASFATTSSAIDLSASYNKNYLIVPTMTSGSEVRIQAAESMSGTYRNVHMFPVNSSTVAVNMFKIPSSVTNAVVEMPAGLRFVKVEVTAVVSFSAGFKIICGGNY